MIDTFIMTVPIFLTALLISLLLVSLVLAVRDALAISRTSKDRGKLPRITIVMLCNGSLESAQRSLKALRRSKYKKFDTVLVSNNEKIVGASSLAKAYTNVYYYRSRILRSHSDLVYQAFMRSKKGAMVVVLDSDCILEPSHLSMLASKVHEVQADKRLDIAVDKYTYGFAGVVLSLSSSVRRILERTLPNSLLNSLRRTRHVYVCSSELIKRYRNVDAVRYDEIVNLPALITIMHDKQIIGLTKSKGLWVVALVLAISFTLLSLQAIDGRGLEAFIWSWIIACIIGLELILFDAQATVRQKVETLTCASFMPILLILASITTVKHK